MNAFRYIMLCSCLWLSSLVMQQANAQTLKVSPDQHYLLDENNTPFFWLGDTAWELFHRLNQEEATTYLQNRADNGFTVIQAVVLAELDGLNTPNAYGNKPLINNDPTQPNEAYFEHVDFIVNKADSLGMFIGMLPTWGDKFNKRWGVGPEVFTPENARAYGLFLGKRYQDKPIVWILGGDRIPEENEDFAIVRAMAEGLAEGDGNTHLMTYHPMGERSSSAFFQNDAWLDFNMLQSGHGKKDMPNYRMIAHDYALMPVKPVLDGEPNYEDHPINWKPEEGWFDEADVRQAAYWAMLAGALGHTYGNHNIWQMMDQGREPISSARHTWKEAIEQPGAAQMGLIRQLFESRPFTTLKPDTSMVKGSDQPHIQAAYGGGFMMAYLPGNPEVAVSLGKISGRKLNTWWYDPRNGDSVEIGQLKNKGTYTFKTPNASEDWVLLLDDASRNFPKPGEKPVTNSQVRK